MKIVQTPIDSLIPYEFNNKDHNEKQVDWIANSISEFWRTQPIVLDAKNIIVAWHWRYEAAKKLGLKEVPVVFAENLTDKQIKRYRLLDNKLSDMAEWNLENIKLELDEIEDIELNDLFPEFDAPDYDPNEYLDDLESENKEAGKITLTVEFETEEDKTLFKGEAENLSFNIVSCK